MRVLLVDDEPNVRMVIRRLLRRQLNVDIEECQNGLEAIERLSREPFDLVLLDVSMPVMDGIDVLQAIRQSPTLNALPVIMITAAASEQTVRRALGEGVSDFLAKPIRPELLCQRVERVVKLIQARKTSPAARAPFEPLDCGDARPILIVDGSAEFRRFFVSAVGSLSPVRQAESGLDALQQCLTSPPYAVFIGSHLGVLGEEMLARKIRALDRCGSVRIVGVKPDHEILAARKSTAYEAVIKRSVALDLFMEGLSAVLRTGTSSSPVLEVLPDLKLLLISAAKESLTTALGDHVILRAPRTRADAAVVGASTTLSVGPAGWPLAVTLNTTPRGAARLKQRIIDNAGLPAAGSPDDAEPLAAPLAALTDLLSREFEARGVPVSRGEAPPPESSEHISVEFDVPSDRIWLRVDIAFPATASLAAGATPADAEPAAADPVAAEPLDAYAAEAEAAQPEPSEAESSEAEPSEPEPSRSEEAAEAGTVRAGLCVLPLANGT